MIQFWKDFALEQPIPGSKVIVKMEWLNIDGYLIRSKITQLIYDYLTSSELAFLNEDKDTSYPEVKYWIYMPQIPENKEQKKDIKIPEPYQVKEYYFDVFPDQSVEIGYHHYGFGAVLPSKIKLLKFDKCPICNCLTKSDMDKSHD